MGRRTRTVVELAREALVEPEDALLILWDCGFDHLESPQSRLGPRELNRARRCLNIPTRREFKDVRYWEAVFDVDREGLTAMLFDLGIELSPAARTLPKGAVSRLKKRIPESRRAASEADAPDHASPDLPFEWDLPGHARDLDYLTEQDVLDIHYAIVEDVAASRDPIEPAGPRDMSLLGGAVFRPMTSLGEEKKYTTVESAAAALLHSLVLDHPFHNGNKRTALVSYLVFLDRNGVVFTSHENTLFNVVLRLAKRVLVNRALSRRSDREVLELANWTCQNSRLSSRGDHPVAWRKLKKILRDYGCGFETVTVGNRLNIHRMKTVETGWKGNPTQKELRTQVYFADDGRDAHVDVLKKIRKDLELDYEHGVDAEDFYGKHPEAMGDFIARYRLTLERLARL